MGLEILLQGAATAASVGMGCGSCCGSSMGAALSGYLMTHAKSFRQSAKGFLAFYLGKLLAVTALCGAASLAGSQLLTETGLLAGLPVKLLVDLFMIGLGGFFLVRWIRERRGKPACAGACGEKAPVEPNARLSLPALALMGVGYGVSPCAPLLMMLGYAATLPVGAALAVGGVFALASAVSPTLVLLLLSGALAGKVYREIPRVLTWFRLACYLGVILFFAIDLAGVL